MLLGCDYHIKKCGALAFICEEALVSLESNKQYSTHPYETPEDSGNLSYKVTNESAYP